ncbi:MAG: hypothetical protein NXI26_24985, partial [bacterium]|nr:hypothetical protein [bacterium]
SLGKLLFFHNFIREVWLSLIVLCQTQFTTYWLNLPFLPIPAFLSRTLIHLGKYITNLLIFRGIFSRIVLAFSWHRLFNPKNMP